MMERRPPYIIKTQTLKKQTRREQRERNRSRYVTEKRKSQAVVRYMPSGPLCCDNDVHLTYDDIPLDFWRRSGSRQAKLGHILK